MDELPFEPPVTRPEPRRPWTAELARDVLGRLPQEVVMGVAIAVVVVALAKWLAAG